MNVAYDPKREPYEDYNKAFAAYWKPKTGGEQWRQYLRSAAISELSFGRDVQCNFFENYARAVTGP